MARSEDSKSSPRRPGEWLRAGVRIHRRYRVLDRLGQGGLGTALRVWDEALERERALKLVDADAVALLRTEFGLLRTTLHPRVVRVHDFGTFWHEGQSGGFYTADLLVGATLDTFAQQHRWAEVRRALVDALTGLGALHQLGVLHGDFKPENIIVETDGRATLLDLSCASRLSQPARELAGTPGFIAPELLRGEPASRRADLYAVGATLRSLTGLVADAPDLGSLVARLSSERPKDRPAEIADVLAALGTPDAGDRIFVTRSEALLDRDAELEAFESVLALAERDADGPRGLLFMGGPGSGKSRLLAELKWRAELRGQVLELVRPIDRETDDGALSSMLRRIGDRRGRSASPISLEAALSTASELAFADRPTTILIDDAGELGPTDQRFLAAMLRTLGPRGRLVMAVASSEPIEIETPSLRSMTLSPLGIASIRAWAGRDLSARRADAVHALTGGRPGYVERCLQQLRMGALSPRDLSGEATFSTAIQAAVRALAEDERAALARVVASLAPLSVTAAPSRSALERLSTKGWTETVDGHVRLAREVERAALEAALDDHMAAAQGDILSEATDAMTRIWCHLGRDELELAERELERGDAAGELAVDLGRWRAVLAALGERSTRTELLLRIAAIQIDRGFAGEGLRTLARARGRWRRRTPPPAVSTLPRLFELAAKAYLQLEQPSRSASYLRRALARAPGEAHLALSAQLARALNQTGAYEEAAACARAVLGQDVVASHLDGLGPDAVELVRGLGVALTFVGDPTLAADLLRYALAHTDERVSPRDASRAHSYLAILAFRAGSVGEAADAYRCALDIAERRDLIDMLPTLHLNVGTACQQLGDWGEALTLYERGHRVARALGKAHAVAILELNLTNLYAEIGLLDRATAMLEQAKSSVEAADLDHLRGHLDTIEAEVRTAEGAIEEAAAILARALERHRSRSEVREQAEVTIALGRLDLWRRPARLEQATARAEAARALLEGRSSHDLDARASILSTLCAVAAGDGTAVHHGREAALRASQAGLPQLIAEACSAAALAHEAMGDTGEAESCRAEAARRWQALALSLPLAMRDAYWRHPRRIADEPTTQAQPAADPRIPRQGERLRRLLTLMARVHATLALDRVLDGAMDAAIELTGAERGFVLLSDRSQHRLSRHADRPPPSDLRVAVARNVDRRHLDSGDLSFSRGIAQEVVRAGRPVVTLDALRDERFRNHRSVHAMQLSSIVCVPVTAEGAVLGALYLDNRFERADFSEEDVAVVHAFAAHIGMAIRNAELHQALDQERKRVAAEKRQVERLSRLQATRIERLEHRVRDQQEALGTRYDYSAIVHRSAAMRDVLSRLDRVIDSDLTVVIEGESGTGKELIAKAIHFQGPRKLAPFLGINCGALSETLLESELFGHVRGAFTGADRDREGLMVAAKNGSLFLDEVGEMPPSIQVKLLRALQEREVRPLGASRTIGFGARVICATNRALRDEVEAGRFREDLYYRLGVVEVRLPPLRERQDDILPIARKLLDRHAEREGRAPMSLSREAVRALLRHRWPGNVRQLENVLARAYLLSDKQTLNEGDLDLSASPERRRDRPTSREEFERSEAERIRLTLLENRWNVSLTARILDMPRNTLYRKMDRLGIRE